jgi:hypothetical protein
MRDDLLDVYACIKWAVAQIDVLKERLIAWDQIPPYRVVAEPDSEPGKKRLRLRDVIAPDPIINAEAGAIINSLRSSLDLMINRLAARNGYAGEEDSQFPISRCREAFFVGKHAGRKEIKRLSAADRAIIEDLEPWRGGKNPFLIALHDLDITRKHKRLIVVNMASIFAMVRHHFDTGKRLPSILPLSCAFEDDAELGVVDIEADHENIEIAFQPSLNETGPLSGEHLVGALQKLANFTAAIIQLFE